MGNLAGLPPLGQKVKKERGTAAARAHMGKVAALRCVCCLRPGPSQVHHVIHGRFSQAKSSDFDTIPLCVRCHTELHANKTLWADRNGFDWEFLPIVADMLRGEWNAP